MHKTSIWGLKMILCVGLMLLGIGPFGLAQSTDNSAEEETQLSNNKIVQILYDKYRVKYELTEEEFGEQIKDYRVNNNLGYGEILILYALADRIHDATQDEGTENDGTITQILDGLLLQRADKGWGEIAQENDLKLGEVISSVMKKEKERNEDTEESGSDHKQGHKNKAKNNNQHHGGGKGKGRSNK